MNKLTPLFLIFFISFAFSRIFYANDVFISYQGRFLNKNVTTTFDWSNSQIKAIFQNLTSLSLMLDDTGYNYFNVFVDETLYILQTNKTTNLYKIPLNATGDVVVYITKRTEAANGPTTFIGFATNDEAKILPPRRKRDRRLQFIGDSITCGYGILGTPPCTGTANFEDDYLTYGPTIARELNADINVVCWSGKGLMKNWNSPTIYAKEPFPIYYNRTLANDVTPIWDFEEYVPQAIVINLGTNDYAENPLPPFDIFANEYKLFISNIRNYYKNADITFFLACGPMTTTPCNTIRQVAESYQDNKVHFVDLQNILTSQDIGCQNHPNINGHKKMANITLQVVKKYMNWN